MLNKIHSHSMPIIIIGIFLLSFLIFRKHLTKFGIASYYASSFHGKVTASGIKYNQKQLTAAHRFLPFGTKVKVTNLRNNLSVIVAINDRGPFVKNRLIDLSYAAAKKIDMVRSGTDRVRLQIIR